MTTTVTTGARIRTLRLRNRLRLQDIADRCGFTKSLLSKIETGVVKPPVATLVGIAKALAVPVSSLLGEHDDGRTVVIRGAASSDHGMERTDKGYRFRLIAGERIDKAMQPFVFRARRGEIKPGSLRHEGEEFVFILSGTLQFRVGGASYSLAEGDGLYFDSGEDHDFTPTTAEATWLAVFHEPTSSPPRQRTSPGRRTRGAHIASPKPSRRSPT
ncbi:MAG: helix-turn-helix transcriptional regulator [Planctomycetes bacterium]|nr:helix-turn-helix transcriptional regulator [Planctomycetota bacterium]